MFVLAAYSRSPAPAFAHPPSLLGGLGAFGAPYGAPPPLAAPQMPLAPAEYGRAPVSSSGSAAAPLERVLAALRQERVLSETQLADLGVSPAALKSMGIDFERYLTNQVFISNVRFISCSTVQYIVLYSY